MDRDEDYAAYVNARWAGLVRAAVLLPNSVVTRTSGREVVAAHPGMVRIGVLRPSAAGIGDVTVRVLP